MKKNLRKLILIFILVVVSTIGVSEVNASANSKYTISLSASNVTKRTPVKLTIKCTDANGGFSIKSSDSTVASVSSNTAWCESDTQVISIETLKAGSASIIVTPISLTDGSYQDLNLPSKNLTLTVNNPVVVKKSNDANLKSLEVEGATLSSEFNKDTLEYSVSLPAETTSIKVIAAPSSDKASISGNGELTVQDGTNKIEVSVRAEDGTIKTYIINATVVELDAISVEVSGKTYSLVRKRSELPKLDLFEESNIKIGEEDVVSYYNEKLKLQVVGLKDDTGVVNLYAYDDTSKSYTKYEQLTVSGTSLYLKNGKSPNEHYQSYDLVIDNMSLDIYKLSKESEFGLVYGINLVTGNEGYYVYDIVEETLQRYFDEEIKLYSDVNDEYMLYFLITLGCVGVSIVILSIVLLIKGAKKRKKRINR